MRRDLLLLVAAQSAERDETWVGQTVDHLLVDAAWERGLIKNLHIDHLTFRRIVMTLHMCDAIIEESEYGKNTVYTLKDAA